MAATKASAAGRTRSRSAAVRSGLPLFHTTRSGRIVEWNHPAEELSGIPASDAVHPGCSVARLALEGWSVCCADLHVRMPSGLERLAVSTIVVGAGDDAVVLHPLRVVPSGTEPPASASSPWSATVGNGERRL